MVRRSSQLLILVLLLSCFAGLSGCGARKVYPVHGKVTFPDGTPLTGGVVEIEWQGDGEKRVNARGTIEKDGTYRLTTFRDGDGALLGLHRVVVVAATTGPGNMDGPPPVPLIDRRFQSYDSSGLTCTVVVGDNSHPIVVERP